MEGKLSKWTNVVKGWQYRWFVLDNDTGVLWYYTSKEKMTRGVVRGCLKLKGAEIGIDDEYGNTFTITTDSKVFHLQANDRKDLSKWVRSLEDTISSIVCDDISPSTLQLDSLLLSSTVQNFDKKMEEGDAYLQIMIEQINFLEAKMDIEQDVEKKSKYQSIINHSKQILDEVKHTIVLLQISKNMTKPENGMYESLDLVNISKNNAVNTNASQNSTETSISSIDEEDFYDANDSHEPRSQTKSEDLFIEKLNSIRGSMPVGNESRSIFSPQPFQPKCTLTSVSTQEHCIKGQEHAIGLNNATNTDASFRKADGSLDYDSLYEMSDQNIMNMENQGSVIAHLLSQVKIGMDLTKVSLPTFILETRSLLEMYADYFAHADMFVKITDFSSEKERIVQVVRWYLCSFHAGKKTSVAKKPYNPVLGEIFQCHWEIPGIDLTSDKPVSDGPVPWCNANHLSFVAEQVSHHPPISAFYAEHYNKQISFNAHIWTKSKFLGLSIGVHNIGHGVINVRKYNEQYVVTFPNGYGRSILTVPWVELGGTVSISCEKTGYRATLEFLTKPFYGGKKHKICGQVYGPNDKDPFLTLTGEWNGVIEAKWSNGKSEQFSDVNKLTLIRKEVRPIEKQGDMESRKLWQEVTAGLKMNDVAHATNAKCSLEQKQRLEARQRKELGIDWTPKLFKQSGDGWAYIRPLSERLSNANNEENISTPI